MKASEKRLIVRDYVFFREGKNQYTQSSKRTQVDNGFSDCSSLQQRAYHEIGTEIGSYTGAQILKGTWVQLGGTLPDEKCRSAMNCSLQPTMTMAVHTMLATSRCM